MLVGTSSGVVNSRTIRRESKRRGVMRQRRRRSPALHGIRLLEYRRAQEVQSLTCPARAMEIQMQYTQNQDSKQEG